LGEGRYLGMEMETLSPHRNRSTYGELSIKQSFEVAI